MSFKKDTDRLFKENSHEILAGIFGMQTEVQVESGMAFAKYMRHVGINKRNFLIFLNIIETNNKWIVNSLLGNQNPSLLFTVLKPDEYLIQRSFQLLAYWHPKQIYYKVLLSILGIIEYSYYKPDDGFRIHELEINDLNNIGKFLDLEKDSDSILNKTILNILDRITHLGEFQDNPAKSFIAKHAFDIRIAFFDNSKSLSDVIPEVLLVKIQRNEKEVKPSKTYMMNLMDIHENLGG